jgi:hypothetical protein
LYVVMRTRGERHLVLLEVREVLDGRFPVA